MKKYTIPVIFILLILLSSLFLSCGTPAATPTTTTTPTTPATTTTPTTPTQTSTTPSGPYGDLVVVRDSLGSEVWAPDVGGTVDSYNMSPVYETLTYMNYDDEPYSYYPRLAERWTVSDDGLIWDFYIHQGIQWQGNYGEVTAADAKYSLELLGSPGSTNNLAAQFNLGTDGAVESYNIIDNYHLQVKLQKANALLLFYTSQPEASIVSKSYFEQVGHDYAMKHPVGTGPWKFVDYQPANYIKFEAVTNHWRKTPDFATLTLKSVPELSARMAMLESGQADIGSVPPDKVAEAEAAGLHIRELGGTTCFTTILGGTVLNSEPNYDPTCPWVYNQDEPWDSAYNQNVYLVRKALSLAVNKQAIIDKILNGAGTLTPLHDWPLGNNWASDAWVPFPYDPDEARALLAQAGYPDGFSKPITMYAVSGGGNPLDPQASEAVAMDWQAIGLDVNIVPIEWSVLRAKTSDRDTAWCSYVTGWGVMAEPWLDIFYSYYSKSSFNDGFESLELDQLLDDTFAIMDTEQRRVASLKVGDFLYDHICDVGIAVGTNYAAMSAKTGTWRIKYLPVMPMDFEYVTHAG
jgi:peptide/nickel transport system substrate-binding protein